jgi:integrase
MVVTPKWPRRLWGIAMPRTSTIRYFKSRQAYYTQFHGHQHLLAAGPKDEPDGKTYLAAVLRFSQIMHADEVSRDTDNCVVSAIIARYYFAPEREGRMRTLHLARTLLDHAIAEFGHIKVKDLEPFAVRDWLAKLSDPKRPCKNRRERPWSTTTQHAAIEKLVRVFYWAKKEGIIETNPIAGMDKPEKRSRGSEVVIPEPLMDVLIDAANPELSKVMRFLRGTGARPGEAIHARASHYRKELGALVYPWQGDETGWRWKNAKKSKRDRVIYLTQELRDLIESEIASHPSGYIFIAVRGKPWTLNNICNRMIVLQEHRAVRDWCRENEFPAENLMLYGFRHSYLTNMLLRGVPIKILADWCGTSVNMLEKVYSHIHDDLQAMRKLFMQFNGGASPPPAPLPSGNSP